MVEFAWPWLFAALPLPWLLWRWLPPAAPTQALHLPHAGLHFVRAAAGWRPRWRTVLLGLAWVFLVTAAARPQWLGPPQSLKSSGRVMMLAVDLSGSMAKEDMSIGGRSVSRFAAVEAIAGDFISRRKGDRLGLVLFGSHAYLVTPVTYDLNAVRAQLKTSAVGLAGQSTAIGDAVGVAVKTLSKLHTRRRVLVLLTDGINNAGTLSPDQAAHIARTAGVRIYAIGIGTTTATGGSGTGDDSGSESGAWGDVNVAMLTQMARSTGGRFFPAASTDALAAAYRAIDALEPVVYQGRPLRPLHELFRWPLVVALLLTLIALLVDGRTLRRREAAA